MLLVVLWWLSTSRAPAQSRPLTFAKDVRPILERRCMPCHFAGGKMYAKLPFDKPETVTKLGTKMFTRIKKEDEAAMIRAFLAMSEQAAKAKPANAARPKQQ